MVHRAESRRIKCCLRNCIIITITIRCGTIFKAHPQASLTDLKIAYLGKTKYDDKRYLNYNFCYLCSYARLIRPMGTTCISCPLCKKYSKTCYDIDSMYRRVINNVRSIKLPEERIAAAEKIRDCVLFWKNRR